MNILKHIMSKQSSSNGFTVGNKPVTADKIDRTNKNNIVLDYDDTDDTPVNLPDVNVLMDQITLILEYMVTDEMKQLKVSDYPTYEEQLELKFPQFAEKYYAVFKKVISGEDITPLFEMLAGIERVKKGKETIEEVETELGKKLAEKYIFPVIDKNKGKK